MNVARKTTMSANVTPSFHLRLREVRSLPVSKKNDNNGPQGTVE